MEETGWLDLPREIREYVYFQAHRLSFRPTLDRIPSSERDRVPVRISTMSLQSRRCVQRCWVYYYKKLDIHGYMEGNLNSTDSIQGSVPPLYYFK